MRAPLLVDASDRPIATQLALETVINPDNNRRMSREIVRGRGLLPQGAMPRPDGWFQNPYDIAWGAGAPSCASLKCQRRLDAARFPAARSRTAISERCADTHPPRRTVCSLLTQSARALFPPGWSGNLQRACIGACCPHWARGSRWQTAQCILVRSGSRTPLLACRKCCKRAKSCKHRLN